MKVKAYCVLCNCILWKHDIPGLGCSSFCICVYGRAGYAGLCDMFLAADVDPGRPSVTVYIIPIRTQNQPLNTNQLV